jgi:hypothetical protein
MRRILSFLLVVSVVGGGRAVAQQPDVVSVLLAAARLPVIAAEARRAGVPDSDIRAALDAMQRRNVPAAEAHDVLEEERNAARERGPIGNFGAFVQTQLDAGLRGRDLAAAIRVEHDTHGSHSAMADSMSANGRANGRDSAAVRGRSTTHPVAPSDTHGKSATKGAPSTKGPPATKGAPATKGPPATKGRPANPDRSLRNRS